MDNLLSLLGNLWAIFVIVLFFGGSIFVHELGHFLAARRRGVKVERFSIGFGPRIFGWRGRDGVEYRVSWLPFGGYVALPQLADLRLVEGESGEDVAALPPISYGTKVLVFVAGAVFNLLFALVLSTLLWVVGRPEPESITTTTIGYVVPRLQLPDRSEVESPAARAGLQPGDIIRAIDGRRITDWPSIQTALVLGTGVDGAGERLAVLTIERDGVLRDVPVAPLRVGEEKFRRIGVSSAWEPVVDSVAANSPAARLGVQAGDRLVTVAGGPVHSLEYALRRLESAPGPTLDLGFRRGDSVVTLAVPRPQAGQTHPLTGLAFTSHWRLRYQSPASQFAEVFDSTLRTLGSLVHPRGDLALANLSGPIGIGRGFWAAAKSDYPVHFAVWLAVLVNISLAIFNLLPIPVLDGGHIVLATIARLRGRPLPANFILTTQSVFIVLLFALMLYVTVFGDLRRIVSDYRADAQTRAATERPAPAPAEPPAPAP